MSLQSDFFTLTRSIFSDRVYPSIAPDSPVTPYATYSRISAIEGSTLDTNGGTDNETNTRMQIDVWSKTYSEAQSKAAAVKTALKGWSVSNVVLMEQDFFETDTKLHRVMLDVSTIHV